MGGWFSKEEKDNASGSHASPAVAAASPAVAGKRRTAPASDDARNVRARIGGAGKRRVPQRAAAAAQRAAAVYRMRSKSAEGREENKRDDAAKVARLLQELRRSLAAEA